MSTRTQIAKAAKEMKIDPNMAYLAFALERVAARIVNDGELSQSIVFKGGYVLFRSYQSRRTTKDLDALGKGIDTERVKKLITKALAVDLNDDIRFTDTKIEDLELHKLYNGIRTTSCFEVAPFKGVTSRGLPKIQFDVSFGDSIPDNLELTKIESLSENLQPISWKVYPIEFIFSEKLHSVFTVIENTRAKDIYDLLVLFDQCDVKKLKASIHQTFKRRESPIPSSFSERSKSIHLEGFRNRWNKLDISGIPSFEESWENARKIFIKLDESF